MLHLASKKSDLFGLKEAKKIRNSIQNFQIKTNGRTVKIYLLHFVPQKPFHKEILKRILGPIK